MTLSPEQFSSAFLMENLVSPAFFTINDSKMLCVEESIIFFLREACSGGEKQKLPADFEDAHTYAY